LAEEQNQEVTEEVTPEAVASEETNEETPAVEAAPVETVTAEAPVERPVRAAGNQPELSDALSPAGGEQAGPLKEVEGGRTYEIIYIAKAGDQAANDATVESLKTLIDGKGGAVDNVRSTEVRRLAYPIKREIEGIYYVVNTRFTTDHMSEVDRFFKLEESVIRHMIIREDS
jgi:small subunit ribosomal protein S6